MPITKLALPSALGLCIAVSVGGAGVATAVGHGAGDQSCGPAHRYIDAQRATVNAHRVVIKGKHARLHCGGADDSSYITGSAVTLSMLKTGTVKVWKVSADPSQGTRTVPATELPKWLKRNADNPIYKINGPSDGVTKLVEEWHP